jgi:hypothetical protein
VDADALRALAFIQRGRPQAEIVPDDATPFQTAEELAAFRKAGYRRVGKRRA